MRFKIFFPTGYKNLNTLNDNVDINIVMENNAVYFATIFTVSNIKLLMEKNNEIWFWAVDALVVKDLEITTIDKVIAELISTDYLEVVASKIGDIESVFGGTNYYSILKEWENDAPRIVSGIEYEMD